MTSRPSLRRSRANCCKVTSPRTPPPPHCSITWRSWRKSRSSSPVACTMWSLPTTLDTSLPGFFDRTKIRLGVAVEGDALRVYISDTPIQFNMRGRDGLIHLVEMWPGSFLFYNTHSLPVRGDDEVAPVPPAS